MRSSGARDGPRLMLVSACAFACLLMTTLALGQDAQLDAEVDRYTLTTDDTLQLTVTLRSTGRSRGGEPTLDPSDDFALVGTPQRHDSYGIANFEITRQSRRVFSLQPRRTGELTVPAVKAEVGGRSLSTQAIKVRVTQGTRGSGGQPGGVLPEPTPGGPASGPPFEGRPEFAITCETDKHELYVNQQLTVDVCYYADYYAASRMAALISPQAPNAEGFVAEDLPDPEAQTAVVNGRQYVRLTNRWALFPTSAGKHAISAAPLELQLPPLYSAREYNSNSVEVRVKPLPAPPAGRKFSGAVGDFSVQLAADKSNVNAGEGLTVRVIVDGSGYLQGMPAPSLELPEWCKVYESPDERSSEPRLSGERHVIGGRAKFEYLVVPRRAERLEIPPISLLYFNPDTGEYATTTSDALAVDVAPGDVILEPDAAGPDAAIHHIHTESPVLFARRPLLTSPLTYAVIALCVLALGVATVVRVMAERRLADPARARATAAARVAARALERAAQAEESEFFEVLGGSVRRYLGDKFSLPASGMSAESIRDALLMRGVAAETANAARDLVGMCHASRFAQEASRAPSREEALQRARELIAAIEDGGRAAHD